MRRHLKSKMHYVGSYFEGIATEDSDMDFLYHCGTVMSTKQKNTFATFGTISWDSDSWTWTGICYDYKLQHFNL